MLNRIKTFLQRKLYNLLKEKFDEVSMSVTDVKMDIHQQDSQIANLRTDIAFTNQGLDKVKDLSQKLLGDLESVVSSSNERMSNSMREMPDFNYIKFENKFRGPEKDVKTKQSIYIQYFEKSTHIVDFGCGRGEFLEALRDNNIHALGVDLDPAMVAHCQSKDLNAVVMDAFEFLLLAKDDEFDGVFCAQMIEHLNLEQLKHFVYLLSKKVRKGAPILFETPNPRCSQAMEVFYTDLTHVKPILPETIAFIAENYGLTPKVFIFSSPVSAELDLNTQDVSQQHLYGDYAIILEK